MRTKEKEESISGVDLNLVTHDVEAIDTEDADPITDEEIDDGEMQALVEAQEESELSKVNAREMQAHLDEDVVRTFEEDIADAQQKGNDLLEDPPLWLKAFIAGGAGGYALTNIVPDLQANDFDSPGEQAVENAAQQAEVNDVVNQLEKEQGEAITINGEIGAEKDNTMSGAIIDAETGEVKNELPLTETAQMVDSGEVQLDQLLMNPNISPQAIMGVLYETDAVDVNNMMETPRIEAARSLSYGNIAGAQDIVEQNPQAFEDTDLNYWIDAMENKFGGKVDEVDDQKNPSVDKDPNTTGERVDDGVHTTDYSDIEPGKTVELYENSEEQLAITNPVDNPIKAQKLAEQQGVSWLNIDVIPVTADDGTKSHVATVDYEETERLDDFELTQDGDITLTFSDGDVVDTTISKLDNSYEFDFVRNGEQEPVGIYSAEYDRLFLPSKS